MRFPISEYVEYYWTIYPLEMPLFAEVDNGCGVCVCVCGDDLGPERGGVGVMIC